MRPSTTEKAPAQPGCVAGYRKSSSVQSKAAGYEFSYARIGNAGKASEDLPVAPRPTMLPARVGNV